jgi:hypothetical protein
MEGREVWACFSAVGFMKKIDLAFCMDPLEKFKGKVLVSLKKACVKRINELRVPTLASKKYKYIPTASLYPLKEIVDEFGVTYFSCTLTYIIAYAIYKGVKDLLFVGANMDYTDNTVLWEEEKGGIEFWLGYAKAKGVKVRFHGKYSKLLKTKSGKLYGYGCGEDLKGGIIKHG